MTETSFVDREMYPFESRFFETSEGRLHYIDEGEGPAVVFVHGTPVWSFLWRAFVAELRQTHRCIAIDHLGYGLSDKPADADYHPRAHSERLSALLEHLGIDDCTLVVHDFGGPIGLGHAIRHPERVARLVVFNTWMWSLADHPKVPQVDRFLNSWLGRFLYLRLNVSARWLVPSVLGKGHKLPWEVHRHYVQAVPDAASRIGHLRIGQHLLGGSDWYDELWQQRGRLADKAALVVWGQQDPTFGADELARWREVLPQAEVLELAESGHFPQEEATEITVGAVKAFVGVPHAGSFRAAAT